jgi:hypothetical protein
MKFSSLKVSLFVIIFSMSEESVYLRVDSYRDFLELSFSDNYVAVSDTKDRVSSFLRLLKKLQNPTHP